MWDKPKQGYLTLDEYNGIMDQARVAHEAHAQQEKKFMVENADELAAKYNREKLKQRRVEHEAKQQKEQAKREKEQQKRDRKEDSGTTSEGNDDQDQPSSSSYSAAAPYGKWQTVEKKEVPYVDLQLPEQSNYVTVPVVEPPKPVVVKVFKEKVVTLKDSDAISSDAGVFKKRKINITLKKNSRQRIEDY